MSDKKNFFTGLKDIGKSIFSPNQEELLHFYGGTTLFLLINLYTSALITFITVTLFAVILSVYRYYEKKQPFLLRTLLFAVVPIFLWLITIKINRLVG